MSTLPPYAILAAVDYSDLSALVVQEAVELARQKHAGQLHFLHVNHSDPDDPGQEARHAEFLEWIEARIRGNPAVTPELKIVGHELSGDPAKLILEMARDLAIDTVVVGTHGRKGMERLLLGSVAAAVVKGCGCGVWVVRQKQHDQVVQIEPPCPRCVEARLESHGKALWCEQHSQKHGRRHTYYDPRSSSWVSHRMLG